MNAEPEIGGRAPLAIDVEAGKSYWWCACGRSKSAAVLRRLAQGHGVLAGRVEGRDQAEQAWFCACKRTGNRPMCDGSHKKL